MPKKKSTPALRSRITSALRRIWRFSPEAKEALAAARVVLSERPRRVAFRCAACSTLHSAKAVRIDHREPVVALEGFRGWDEYITRLFCPATGLQVLCEGCHEVKTREERSARPRKPSAQPSRSRSSR